MQSDPQTKDFILAEKPHSPMTLWRSLEKAQKIALVALAVFVLFLLIFWSVQFKKSLVDPFTYKGDGAKGVATTIDSDEALKQKDTDGDSISDWDEINVYKTSPYLEDTDGDGIADGEEVKRNSDPNCPEGSICRQVDISNNNGNVATSSLDSNFSGQFDQPGLQASSSNEELSKMLSGQIDAANLRKIMIEAGMDEAALNGFGDEELIKIYQESLKQE